jgi:hypothetical protein
VEIELDGKRMTAFKEDAAGLNRFRNKEFVPNHTEQVQLLQTFIRTMVNPKYATLYIKSVFTRKNSKYYLIHVGGDGSLFCMNVNRNHSNNSIYFILTNKGLFQKCFSRKKCAAYESRKIDVTNKIMGAFFPSAIDANGGGATADDRDLSTEMMMAQRNNTKQKSNSPIHRRAVERAIQHLRVWLKNKAEDRLGVRNGGFRGQQHRKETDSESYLSLTQQQKATIAKMKKLPQALRQIDRANAKPRAAPRKRKRADDRIDLDLEMDASCP